MKGWFNVILSIWSWHRNTNLCLVPDEVDLRLAGCGRSRCGYRDLGLLVGLLHQHVDECLLLVLRDQGDVGHGGWWWCGCLDEHDLVVLLWRRLHDRSLGRVVRGLWGWHVHVHVFVDDGSLLWGSVHGGLATWVALAADGRRITVEGQTATSEQRSFGARLRERHSYRCQQLKPQQCTVTTVE